MHNNNHNNITNQNDIKTLIYIYFLSVFLFYIYDLSKNKKTRHDIREYIMNYYGKTKEVLEERVPLLYATILAELSKWNIQVTNDTSSETTSISSEEERDKEKENEKDKEEIKYEDKYNAKWKQLENDFVFTREELQVQQEKYEELKIKFEKMRKLEIDNLQKNIDHIEKVLYENNTDEMIEVLGVNADIYNEEEVVRECKNILFQYMEQLENIEKKDFNEVECKEEAKKYITDIRLHNMSNNYIFEMTPLGNVAMKYNHQKNTFEYFSNHTIPYRYLESIGKKYVITYKCKPIFIDMEHELSLAEQKAKELKEQKEEEASKKREEPLVKSVFAKLKTYNQDTQKPSQMSARPGLPPQIRASIQPISQNHENDKLLLKENANRYTWEGRFANFSILKKVKREVVDKRYSLSFADFKKQLNQKK